MRICGLLTIATAACSADPGSHRPDRDATGNGEYASAHALCLTETNRYRATRGLLAVSHSAALEAYADVGAEEDHNSTPHAHFSRTSGGGIAHAENECPHWNLASHGNDVDSAVAACLSAFYAEGPNGLHYATMMGMYSKLGCGIHAAGGTVTIVQDFAR